MAKKRVADLLVDVLAEASATPSRPALQGVSRQRSLWLASPDFSVGEWTLF